MPTMTAVTVSSNINIIIHNTKLLITAMMMTMMITMITTWLTDKHCMSKA